ncbi:YybH family protein [Tardiphaga sp. 20_F10_N6_6]|uniref:YybH family protein n=1 Tax=Tardiphaga sp. 20_F10_N6_6 TaxID=3240788 RepID=UPI003F892357
MPTTRRSLLAAGGAGFASLATGSSARSGKNPSVDQVVADLVGRSEEANAALMRGDIGSYRALITLTDDFTLMSPFGGNPSRGAHITEASWEAIGRFFRNGNLKQQLVQAYGTTDMVVLAVIEHGHGEVGGLPAQDWPLRVTLVYRRDGTDWRLAHRHADPLVAQISLAQCAALARGA